MAPQIWIASTGAFIAMPAQAFLTIDPMTPDLRSGPTSKASMASSHSARAAAFSVHGSASRKRTPLELDHRPAEGDSLARVRGDLADGAPGEAEGLGRAAQPGLVERFHRETEAGAPLAEAMRGRHAGVGEPHRRLRGTAKPGKALVADHFGAPGTLLHQERGDTPVASVWIGLREHREDVRDASVRAPSLGSIEDVAVAVALRGGRERGDIRPGAGLGEGEAGISSPVAIPGRSRPLSTSLPYQVSGARPTGHADSSTPKFALERHTRSMTNRQVPGPRPRCRTPRAPRARTGRARRPGRGDRGDRCPTRRWRRPAAPGARRRTGRRYEGLRARSRRRCARPSNRSSPYQRQAPFTASAVHRSRSRAGPTCRASRPRLAARPC